MYELVGDSAANQTCARWLLGHLAGRERNGSQVVVNGHPAFTYVGDKSAGQTKGQNLKDQWGLWLALDASGNPISARRFEGTGDTRLPDHPRLRGAGVRRSSGERRRRCRGSNHGAEESTMMQWSYGAADAEGAYRNAASGPSVGRCGVRCHLSCICRPC